MNEEKMATQTKIAKRKVIKPPTLPAPLPNGNYPAALTLRAILAQQIAGRRRAAGMTQVVLARRARVRLETINRLEAGKHAANVETVDRIDRALRAAGV
jgi:DNA-binding XRE family transcriptional regulator